MPCRRNKRTRVNNDRPALDVGPRHAEYRRSEGGSRRLFTVAAPPFRVLRAHWLFTSCVVGVLARALSSPRHEERSSRQLHVLRDGRRMDDAVPGSEETHGSGGGSRQLDPLPPRHGRDGTGALRLGATSPYVWTYL